MAWMEAGAIAPERVAQALVLSGVVPDGQGWQRFMDRLLLVLGALTLAAAVIFFFAYNWNALGKLAQFALAEVLVVLPLLVYWKLGVDKLAAKVSLLVAAIMVGALLAVFGQTYQTGADTMDLFATWAVLILPWVLVGQFPALWLLWLALLNVSVFMYCMVFRGLLWMSFGSTDQVFWLLLLLNTAAWALWEVASLRFAWLVSPWAVRTVAVASGSIMSLLVLHAIFDESATLLPWLAYITWMAGVYAVYRRKRPELFILAGACLSLIVCITTLVAKLMLERSEAAGLMLFLAMLVVAEAAAAAIWLKRVHAEMPR